MSCALAKPISWVSARHAKRAEVRLFEDLFTKENPDDGRDEADFTVYLNKDSLQILSGCMVEPSLENAKSGIYYQFLRKGYFYYDTVLSVNGKLVFNRTVGLRDNWAKINKK